MRRAELVMAVVMAALSLYLMWKSAELPIGWIPDEGPGGGAFPFWLSAGMLVCTLVIMLRWFRGSSPLSRSDEPYMDERGVRLFLVVAGSLTAMLGLIHVIGIYGSVPLFLAFYMRNMGGLAGKMPITYVTMLIGTLAISGVPLFSGFLSKDAILAGTLAFAAENTAWWAILFPVAGFGAAAITAFYMFRLIFMTFHGEPAKESTREHVHESPLVMTGPLMLLAALSFAMFFTLPHINPLHSEGWLTQALPSPPIT